MVLRIDFVLVRHDFHYQRRTGLAVFRELASRQEQAGRAVAQDIGVVDLLALELRHLHRFHLRRRRVTALEPFAGVIAGRIGAAQELAEAAGLELLLTDRTRGVGWKAV